MAEAALKYERYTYSSPLPEAVIDAPAPDERAIPRELPRAIPKPELRPRVSAFSVLGFLFIAALAVFCMLSYVELTKISADITGIRAVSGRIEGKVGISERLEAQKSEHNALRLEYERTFDLKEIETYATGVLGMVRAQSSSERSGMSVQQTDKAMIPASAQRSGGLKGFFEMVTEYFR